MLRQRLTWAVLLFRHNVLSDSLGGNTRRFLQASSLLAKIDEEKLKVMFEVLDEDDSGGLDKEVRRR